LVWITGGCEYGFDGVDNIIDISIGIENFAGCDIERHFHCFVGNRIGDDDGLVVDIQTVRVDIVEFLTGGAEIVSIIKSGNNGIIGNL
jgi:hypothetical protein